MAYTKTTWVNDSEPSINAENLNKIETGIEDAHKGIEALDASAVKTVNGIEPDAYGNVVVSGGGEGGGGSDIQIANNLTTTVTGKALDATQGRILNEKITAETERALAAEATSVKTVNGITPNSNGEVTVTSDVTSVNGQTGAVTIDVGVKKVNNINPDQEGNVNISIPVTSVNGKTGDVTIDIGDAAVTSVNGQTGDVTVNIGQWYHGTLTADGWSGSAQTITVAGITSDVMLSPVYCPATDNVETNATLQSELGKLITAKVTVGNGTVALEVASGNEPECDLELYWWGFKK